MGQKELEAALRAEGEARAREVWREAEQEADQLRGQTEAGLIRLRQGEEQRLAQLSARTIETARSRQARQTLADRLETESQLAERLQQLAVGQLSALATVGGAELFRALAAEIPAGNWEKVRVNPRDRLEAQNCFPRARIVTDDAICGGLLAEDPKARVTIINTLEKRLEHCWALLLPEMIAELRRKARDHAST